MSAEDRRSALSGLVGRLTGEECWSVICGEGTGSVLSLGFGARRPRRRWLGNPSLPPEERRFEGEYLLFIEAAWRVERQGEIVSTWTTRGVDSRSGQGLPEMIEGARVVRGQLSEGGLDLQLAFDSGYELIVFCDQGETDGADNYHLSDATTLIAVGPLGEIQIEERPE